MSDLAEQRDLTPELLDLLEDEKVIERGLATFVEVGNVLVSIRDRKKYQAGGYATFEDYCDRRWNMSREHGRRMMVAAETASLIEMPPIGGISPQSESQLRALAPLRSNPEAVRDAWAGAVEAAGGRQPTARQVEDAARRIAEAKREDVEDREWERDVAERLDVGRGAIRTQRQRILGSLLEVHDAMTRLLAWSLDDLLDAVTLCVCDECADCLDPLRHIQEKAAATFSECVSAFSSIQTKRRLA